MAPPRQAGSWGEGGGIPTCLPACFPACLLISLYSLLPSGIEACRASVLLHVSTPGVGWSFFWLITVLDATTRFLPIAVLLSIQGTHVGLRTALLASFSSMQLGPSQLSRPTVAQDAAPGVPHWRDRGRRHGRCSAVVHENVFSLFSCGFGSRDIIPPVDACIGFICWHSWPKQPC